MADGLTVPFALAAGVSGAVAASAYATRLVVTAGLAEIAAGSIAMGLGGYLAAKTDVEHYDSERDRAGRFRDSRAVRGVCFCDAARAGSYLQQ